MLLVLVVTKQSSFSCVHHTMCSRNSHLTIMVCPLIYRVFQDDVWAIEFAKPFACVDPENNSKTLFSTRIKGLIPKGTEVEVELLGLQTPVELLANVAEPDDAQVPPVCLEIAQLCGEPYPFMNEDIRTPIFVLYSSRTFTTLPQYRWQFDSHVRRRVAR